jgi:hypothetical protein
MRERLSVEGIILGRSIGKGTNAGDIISVSENAITKNVVILGPFPEEYLNIRDSTIKTLDGVGGLNILQKRKVRWQLFLLSSTLHCFQ